MMAKAARTLGPGLARGLRRAVWIGLGLYLLLSLYVLWRSAVLTPFSDEIDWVGRWYGLKAGHDWAGYLLAPVNLQRVALTFGLLALDIQALGGTNLPLIVSGALGLAVMAGVLGRQAWLSAPEPMKLPGMALAVMLVLMAGNLLDAATPICVDYIHGAVFAVLALVLAEGAEGRSLAWRGSLALLCAMLAGLGDGAGLAVWPVLGLCALGHRRWVWLAAVAVVGGGYLALYLHGQGGGAGASAGGALQHPWGAVRLALAYLMLPWSRLLLGYAWIGGLAVAAVAVAALALQGGPVASPVRRTARALILFTLATAAMAGLGRSGLEDAANVPLRYAVLVSPLHVGLLMLALPWTGELWRANRPAAQALAAAVLLAVFAQDLVMAAKVIRASDTTRNLIADFKAGRRTPPMQVTVHPDLAHAQALYDRLRQDGLFQRELHLKPRPPAR